MKKKLLLADDSITIRKVVGMIFAAEDYELLVAGDGNTAYEMAIAHTPELVIADVSMPGKDGFELCRAVKSHPALAATSVLLLPGAFEVFDEQKAALVGADGWLVKPFESKTLIDKVKALLSTKPLRIEPVDDTFEDSLYQPEDAVAYGSVDDTEEMPEVPVEEELSIEDDDQIWGSVSFEEENLKPHDLLAATDADEEEDEEDAEPETDSPWNDILSVENPGAAEPASEADEDELIELMEEDPLDQEELIEDRETFVGHDEDDADGFEADFDDDADNGILDLTEDDIVASTDLADEPLTELHRSEDTEPVHELAAADSATTTAGALWPDDEADEETKPPSGDEDVKDFVFDVNEDASAELTAEETPGFVFTDARELPVAESADAQDHDFIFVDDEGGSVNTDTDFAEQEATPEFAYVAASADEAEAEDSDLALYSETPAPAAPGRQIEDQLSALSEEELKQIIERVAGPMIEKLAKDLLEKMVWEVVPDLAEALIREEIQKIKTDNN